MFFFALLGGNSFSRKRETLFQTQFFPFLRGHAKFFIGVHKAGAHLQNSPFALLLAQQKTGAVGQIRVEWFFFARADGHHCPRINNAKSAHFVAALRLADLSEVVGLTAKIILRSKVIVEVKPDFLQRQFLIKIISFIGTFGLVLCAHRRADYKCA